jgi:ADP-ribose pyrophosphatase YjhB (NUDIX family)
VGSLDSWKYCPRCASPLVGNASRLACGSCGFVAYASSVPGAEAVLLDGDGRVLLGRRRFEPRSGYWDLPGGFLEEGEEPLDALRREVREETGLEVEPLRFLGLWNEPYDGRIVLCLTWLARGHGDARAGDDLVELCWFAPTELPWEELAFTHYSAALSAGLGEQHAQGAGLDPQLGR